jgi:hypothetical protein
MYFLCLSSANVTVNNILQVDFRRRLVLAADAPEIKKLY